MASVRVELTVRWFCPNCGRQHGLRNVPEVMVTYIHGPLAKVVTCRECERSYDLEPAIKPMEVGK